MAPEQDQGFSVDPTSPCEQKWHRLYDGQRFQVQVESENAGHEAWDVEYLPLMGGNCSWWRDRQ